MCSAYFLFYDCRDIAALYCNNLVSLYQVPFVLDEIGLINDLTGTQFLLVFSHQLLSGHGLQVSNFM